jgi:hypothetical protein
MKIVDIPKDNNIQIKDGDPPLLAISIIFFYPDSTTKFYLQSF